MGGCTTAWAALAGLRDGLGGCGRLRDGLGGAVGGCETAWAAARRLWAALTAWEALWQLCDRVRLCERAVGLLKLLGRHSRAWSCEPRCAAATDINNPVSAVCL